jgi:hypothetical protein
MKNKRLKTYLKFGILLFGISFLNYSCEKDIEQDEDIESKDSNLFSTINFSTFKYKIEDKDIDNSDINSLVSNQNVPIGELQYTTQSQSFVTAIDSTDVLMAEKDGITSFTFKTQTTDMSKTTNYVLAYNDNSLEEFYIIYEEDGSGKVIDPTSGYEVTTQSSGSVWCPIATTQWLCNCADHELGSCVGFCSSGFYQTTNITYEYCGPALGEGGGGGSGNGNGSGGGDGEGTGGSSGDGTGGGNDLPIDGPIITKPVKPEPPTPDCNELAKNEEDASFNEYMQVLKDNVANGTVEKGFNTLYLPATATEPAIDTYVFPQEVIEGTADKVDLPDNLYRKSASHNHLANNPNHLKTYPPMDIVILGALLNVQQNNTNSPLQVEQLAHNLAAEDGTYALKVDANNLDKLLDFTLKYPITLNDVNGNQIPNPNWDFDLYRKVNNYYKEEIDPTFTKNKQIKAFLGFVSKRNLGVTLYEKNELTDKWEKVHLDNNGTVKRTPCDEL